VTKYWVNSLLLLKISLGLKVNSDADFDDSPSCLISVIFVTAISNYTMLNLVMYSCLIFVNIHRQFDQNKTP